MSGLPQASFDSGRTFLNAASGRWAGERLLKAMTEGRPITTAELRTCDTLRKDEWKFFDEALIQEGVIRLRGIADLISAGLTMSVPNALGKTLVEYEKITDMEAAITSLDGLARSDNDRQTFELGSVPLPITHKDFNISIRTLSASRERGESLDTTQARTAGRLVSERLEYMLFNGGPTFMGVPIYGYTNHPNRNTGGFSAGTWSAGARTGAEILTDQLAIISALQADGFNGPYWTYVSANMSTKLEEDFKANSDRTIRERLLTIDELQAIRVVDQMPTNTVITVQATRDVVVLVDGESLRTVQWDIYGGFAVAFKALAIQIPLIRAAASGKSGVYHMS